MARAKSASKKGAGTVTKKTAAKAKSGGGASAKAKRASSKSPPKKAVKSAPKKAAKAAPKKAAPKKAAPKKAAPKKAAPKKAAPKKAAPKKAAGVAKKAVEVAKKAAGLARKAVQKAAPKKAAGKAPMPKAAPIISPPPTRSPSIPPEADPKVINAPPLPEGMRAHPDSELGERQSAYLYSALLAERNRVTQGMGRHIAAAIGEGEPMAEEMDMAQRHAEQAYLMRFADKERKLLREIDHALSKFEEGEYGLCEGTGEPISYRRLELRPWTRYSVEYKEQIEREKRQHR
jgi:DnaK suppressor protein